MGDDMSDGRVAIVSGSNLGPPKWAHRHVSNTWREWQAILESTPRMHAEALAAYEHCAHHDMTGGRNHSWAYQKACRVRLLGRDHLNQTLLWTGRPPEQPDVWRAMHAAINHAYAAIHGYDLYYADVSSCARHPSWCSKLCAYSLLFESWEEWPLKPLCALR